MERHDEARAARQEFGAFLDQVKREAGIERRFIAEMMGMPAPTLSRMAADEVRDRPTFAPPANWRVLLAPHLRALGAKLAAIADALEPAAAEQPPQ